MENASYARVRLESPPYNGRKGIVALSSVFITGLVACLAIGIGWGPKVFDTAYQPLEANSLNVTWYGFIDGMEPWHQMLFLHMRLQKPHEGAMTYEQKYTVSSWGSEKAIDASLCPNGCTDCNVDGQCQPLSLNAPTDRIIQCPSSSKWCGWTTLLTEDFVQYGAYYMKVNMEEPDLFRNVEEFTLEFEIVFVTHEFTHFEMVWFYTWVGITLGFMFLPRLGFFTEMRKLHQNFWSRQQVRVGVMLVGLLFFNNVFFAAQIYSSYPRFFFSVYVILLATFLALVLFFWLELFGDMAAGNMQGTDAAQEWERNRKKALAEYLPKMLLVGLIWIVTILVYIYVRVKQTGDPSYSSYDDLSSYTTVKVTGIILATIYFAWLGIYIYMAFRHINDLNPEYQFILGITLFTIVATVGAVYSGALAPDPHGSVVFCTFSGLFNIYVLLLAYCYTPMGALYGDIASNDVEMVPSAEEDGRSQQSKGDDAFTIVESERENVM